MLCREELSSTQQCGWSQEKYMQWGRKGHRRRENPDNEESLKGIAKFSHALAWFLLGLDSDSDSGLDSDWDWDWDLDSSHFRARW